MNKELVTQVADEIEQRQKYDDYDMRIKALAFAVIGVEILVLIFWKQLGKELDSVSNVVTKVSLKSYELEGRIFQLEIKSGIRDSKGKIVTNE